MIGYIATCYSSPFMYMVGCLWFHTETTYRTRFNFHSFQRSVAICKFGLYMQRVCGYFTKCKIAKTGNLRKFNPAKVKAYTVHRTSQLSRIIHETIDTLYPMSIYGEIHTFSADVTLSYKHKHYLTHCPLILFIINE